MTRRAGPSSALVWANLIAVYIIWGSTYFAIRYAIGGRHGDTGLPPLLMAAIRFLLAGGLLFGYAVRRPHPDGEPDRLGARQWRATAIVGVALLFGGNGLVTLAEQRVDSSVAAVLIATTPLWVALIAWARGDERLPRPGVVGVVLGFLGVCVLAWPSGSARIDIIGALMVVGASLSWALGSYYSRRAPMPRRPLVMTGMEMLCASLALFVVSFASGDAARFQPSEVDAVAWLSLAYLVVFGAMVAFTAYVWLLRNAQLSLVTTYAYVNPVVAIALGVAIAGEPLTARGLVASGIIVAAVALIVSTRGPRGEPDDNAPEDAGAELPVPAAAD
jgi:drug/metabolite transporter (DMT)-like permease